jgi:predicted aspartyl protease
VSNYNAKLFDPPAPVAYVTIRNPATGASLRNILMLIDTGADATALPRTQVGELGIEADTDTFYEVVGFDGQSRTLSMAVLELEFLNRKFNGQFLLVDQPFGILGRNILNNLHLLLDGPHRIWEEKKK